MPSAIRVNSLYRDRWNGDDAFAIYIDAFNDNQNAKWFGTTPGGIRFDQLVSDDGATLNGELGHVLDGRDDDDRATAGSPRCAFPSPASAFAPTPDGEAIMGLTVTRVVSRSTSASRFRRSIRKFEFRRPSVARDVVLRGVQAAHAALRHAVCADRRRAQRRSPPAPRGIPQRRHTSSNEAGLDVRYPLSGNLTLDLTANTDFAQVEADDQQVNLDRFPLFFPERRRFFQEGSGIFDFTTGGGLRLFNSRRIGLSPGLEPVPVAGGARLVGRAGGWDVGFLEMQTKARTPAPGENFGVLRLRHPVFNQYSTLGAMATSFLSGGRRNTALGGDGVFRVHGDQYVGLRGRCRRRQERHDVECRRAQSVDLKFERRTGRGLAVFGAT